MRSEAVYKIHIKPCATPPAATYGWLGGACIRVALHRQGQGVPHMRLQAQKVPALRLCHLTRERALSALSLAGTSPSTMAVATA